MNDNTATTHAPSYVIAGCRSPLVVDYEESLQRLGTTPRALINFGGTARALNLGKVIEVDNSSGIESLSASEEIGFITCAFAAERRRELADEAKRLGFKPGPALIDPTAVLPASIRVGEGSFINAAAVIGGATFIGSHTLINRSASIGHHCVIGDFVSIAPGVTLASNVKIGSGVTIGVGAVVVPNITIGEGAVIGAGSLIRKDVEPFSFWAGNPAKSRELDRKASSLNTEGEE